MSTTKISSTVLPGLAKTKATAPCGCKYMECDCCKRMVPAGEIVFLEAGDNSSGSDTYACCACRKADAQDYHPTCEACGSCSECSCKTASNERLAQVGKYDASYVSWEDEDRDCLSLATKGRTRNNEE